MPRFRDTSVRGKLILINLLTTTIALVLAGGSFIAYQQFSYRREMAHDLGVLSQIIAFESASALSFDDPSSAEHSLMSLSAQPNIIAACIYDRSGKVFAKYVRTGATPSWPRLQPAGRYFRSGSFEVFHPIVLDQEETGTIYLQSDLTEMRARTLRYVEMGGFVLLVTALIAFLIASRLQRLISGPISQLAATVGIVSMDKNYNIRAVKQGDDELGRLIDGFNEMLSQIQARDADLQRARDELEKRVEERTQSLTLEVERRETLHRQLLEVSRQAGMAEVATGVLHNVGNVLNSVNVSANIVVEEVRRSKMDYLSKIGAMLKEHRADLPAFLTEDPKGSQIPDYLPNLAADLVAEQKTIAEELDRLQKNIDHIKEIVSMQQSYAKIFGVAESVAISELVEDALRMNAGALARHEVRVIRDYRDNPTMTVEKHKVLQILVNLIRNAKYACDESHSSEKQIILRVTAETDLVRIAVIDNGVGIPPENLTRIFALGFTTRKDGHGFGLHSGALAAKELGGSLAVHSDGPGQGASFTIELPLKKEFPP